MDSSPSFKLAVNSIIVFLALFSFVVGCDESYFIGLGWFCFVCCAVDFVWEILCIMKKNRNIREEEQE